jgi:hypothetical protein
MRSAYATLSGDGRAGLAWSSAGLDDSLAADMIRILDNTGPRNGRASDHNNSGDLIEKAQRLLDEVHAAAT